MSLDEGQTLALVGANGAGKTTLLRSIAGAHPVTSGSIRFDGRDITAVPAHTRVRQGIAMVPEGRRLFADLTVRENLLLAGGHGRDGRWTVDAVVEAFPMLAPLLDQRASTLSGGQQQAAAIGRGLMSNPRLLLLDEVSLGLAPVAVEAVYESLRGLSGTSTAIVLVEQDLNRAIAFSDRVTCLLEGQVVLEGDAASMDRDRVTQAYFGLGSRGSSR